ncbi:MAG: FeoB-associated Cys-rich membrane protein [Lentimicrobiaceae bacterium]|jgi:FtsZ-interacting cell division protein ZipA
MGNNWLIIILSIVAVIALIIFLIWRNQKDKKNLMRKLIEEDKLAVPEEHDTEADQTED